MPYLKEQKIGRVQLGIRGWEDADAISVGLPWQRSYNAEPPVWFHEIFHTDGTPYEPNEVTLIKRLTGAK